MRRQANQAGRPMAIPGVTLRNPSESPFRDSNASPSGFSLQPEERVGRIYKTPADGTRSTIPRDDFATAASTGHVAATSISFPR